MQYKSMREWLQIMEQSNLLRHVTREVDLKYELGAISKQACGKYTLIFDKVKGEKLPEDNKIPVVTGLCGSRSFYAKAFGVGIDDLGEHFAKAQDHPIAPVIIEDSKAPVKEVITKDVNLYDLPVTVLHEKDSGQYISSAVLITKNPVTGERNVAIHRLQLHDKNHLNTYILPKDTMSCYKAAEEMGQPLEVALCIGVDPIILCASQASAPRGFDELGIAGALYGAPVELVKGETIACEALAHAEIVLEGLVLPNVRMPEGPFGEFPRTYSPVEARNHIEITCMMTRKDPMYHTIVAATNDHTIMGAICKEGYVKRAIKETVPTVQRVRMTEGGANRFHLIVQIHKTDNGQPFSAACAAISRYPEIKHVLVVDDDVDIYDPVDIDCAIATRCQMDKDLFVIPRMQGNKFDPSSDQGISAKMGIDATKPLGTAGEKFARIRIPGEENIHLEDYIKI